MGIDNIGTYNNGILILRTENASLTNVASINSFRGLYLEYGINNFIANSLFSNNVQQGVRMWDSNGNNINQSSISNNLREGLELNNARNNLFDNNYITLNLYGGISIEDDDHLGSNIFFNNLLNNTYNIADIDGNGLNSWNVTSTSQTNIVGGPSVGGNYWATPNGTGYSQTCQDINSDGFCDQPYLLEINNTDYLPLKI